MLRPAILAAAILLALSTPAAAACVALPSDASDYPQGQEKLLLCQQRELSDAVNEMALAEQLRALERQIQDLRLKQQRLLMRPIRPFEVPRF